MYPPFVGGWQPHLGGQFNFGAPFGQNLTGGMANLFGQYAQGQLFSTHGYSHNQFSPTQSFYDQQLATAYEQAKLKAMETAGIADREYRDNLIKRGGLSPTAQALLGQATTQIALIDPSLADAMHGRRGSATVMAKNAVSALRYMRDSSGRDFDINNAGQFTQDVFKRLYGRESVDMSGIGAGRAGEMFDEMARRGQMHTAADPEKVSQRLQEMARSVSAIRDLFGANGKPNAPMAELFDGLNAITQGNMHWMSGAETENTVRRVHALSRNVQGGLDRYTMLARQGTALAGMAGIDSAFGMHTAQSSMAFGKAFGQLAGKQGFGGLSMDEATALDQQLRTAAAGSGQANALGAFIDMADQGLFAEGSDAHRLAAHLKSGDPALRQAAMEHLKKIPSTRMRQELTAMAMAGGVSGATANSFFMAGDANQEAIFRNNLGDVVRDMQGEGEVANIMRSGLQSGMLGVFGANGFSNKEMETLLPVASEAARKALMDMDPDLISNPDRVQERNNIVQAAIAAAIGPENVARLGPRIREVVAASIRQLEAMVKRDPNAKKFKNLAGLISMNRKGVLNATNQEVNKADAEGKKQSRASGIEPPGESNPVSRFFDAINKAGKDTTIWDIAAQVLGGVDTREVNAANPGAIPRGGAGTPGKPGVLQIRGTLKIDKEGNGTMEGTSTNAPGSTTVPAG